MLIQMPRGPGGRVAPRKDEEANPFESGLRRDLAGAPVVSYDPPVGGWLKRAIDLALAVLTAPLWLLAIGVCAVWARMRGVAHVFLAEDFVGHGGRAFSRYVMQLAPQSAVVAAFPGAAAPDIESAPQPAPSAVQLMLERLPSLFNVLRGEMSLVGPAPLTPSGLEMLKNAKRFYISARPGLIGLELLGEMNCDETSQCKAYALSWSPALDAAMLWNAARRFTGSNRDTAEAGP